MARNDFMTLDIKAALLKMRCLTSRAMITTSAIAIVTSSLDPTNEAPIGNVLSLRDTGIGRIASKGPTNRCRMNLGVEIG
jgi:hypothetical protein